MNQNNASFATAVKTLLLGIGQKGLFLKIATLQIIDASQSF